MPFSARVLAARPRRARGKQNVTDRGHLPFVDIQQIAHVQVDYGMPLCESKLYPHVSRTWRPPVTIVVTCRDCLSQNCTLVFSRSWTLHVTNVAFRRGRVSKNCPLVFDVLGERL